MARMTIEEALAATEAPLSRKVLQYSTIFKQIVGEAKQPGFSAAAWAPLGELIAQDEFERVGVAKEVMDWRQYTAFLTQYAGVASWSGVFRRVTEVPGLVFLELEEHNTMGDRLDISNTLTVYEFNAAGKLRHLDVYLQRDMPMEFA